MGSVTPIRPSFEMESHPILLRLASVVPVVLQVNCKRPSVVGSMEHDLIS
jgi:hypothetical protein